MTGIYADLKVTIVKLPTYGALFAMAFLLTACASNKPMPEPRRPLTEKESSVKMVEASQEITLALRDGCRTIGKMETFHDPYDLVVRTAAVDGNVAQILYATEQVQGSTYYGQYLAGTKRTNTYDVRFWKCPEKLKEQF